MCCRESQCATEPQRHSATVCYRATSSRRRTWEQTLEVQPPQPQRMRVAHESDRWSGEGTPMDSKKHADGRTKKTQRGSVTRRWLDRGTPGGSVTRRRPEKGTQGGLDTHRLQYIDRPTRIALLRLHVINSTIYCNTLIAQLNICLNTVWDQRSGIIFIESYIFEWFWGFGTMPDLLEIAYLLF